MVEFSLTSLASFTTFICHAILASVEIRTLRDFAPARPQVSTKFARTSNCSVTLGLPGKQCFSASLTRYEIAGAAGREEQNQISLIKGPRGCIFRPNFCEIDELFRHDLVASTLRVNWWITTHKLKNQ